MYLAGKPPPRLTIDRFMPRSAQVRKIAAVEASARSQASTLFCWEPTWNEMPCGHEALPVGVLQDVGGIGRLAAELARQRPVGPGIVAMDAADHPGAGCDARDLLGLGLAVDGEQPDAELEGGGDLALLLDGVAVGDAVGRGAGGQHRLGLAHRGDVEAGAQLDQELQDLRRRVGLDGVVDFAVGQRLGEGIVVVADDIEVDHEAGSFIGAALEKFANACGHLDLAPLIRSAAQPP